MNEAKEVIFNTSYFLCTKCGWIGSRYYYKRHAKAVAALDTDKDGITTIKDICWNCFSTSFMEVLLPNEYLGELKEKILTKGEIVELLI